MGTFWISRKQGTLGYKADDGFPGKYCYSHDDLRGVKLELYATVHTLTAKYHMSDAQVEGSIKKIAIWSEVEGILSKSTY